jgi:hypothetical protein
MTKIATAGAVLVLAIVFGFIFWSQFTSNQQQLSGGNPSYTQNNNSQNNANVSTIPKNDNLDLIDTDLNSVDVNSIDSDSGKIDAQLKSF